MNLSRLLTAPGPDARCYIVRRGNGTEICTFVTAGVNGNSPDDTAVGNLSDLSEQTDGPLFLDRVEYGRVGAEYNTRIGRAEHGLTVDLRPEHERHAISPAELLARFEAAGWRIADDGDPYRLDD